jgi:lactate dehydrogenase-like 2-hydroxyacid dehydrogenase
MKNMKVAFFSSKSYDEEYFNKINEKYGYKLQFFETRLDSHTVKLTKGFDAVCVFVNDKVDVKTLKHVKQGAMLINTSRGKLIDTEAVIESLRKKRLGSLGIDVYAEEEKLFFKDLSEMIIDDDTISRLIALPNVLITDHQAFLTREALEQIAETTLQNISGFEKGEINKKNQVGTANLG